MSRHDIEIKVPVLSLDVKGEYSRFKKPAGLEYLILTAIGTDSLNEDRWDEFFERLAIPKKMAPLFRNVMENLYDNQVVDNGEFDIHDEIRNIGFTDTGRDLFEQGRIKQEPKTFRETVFYAPFMKQSDPEYFFTLKTSNRDSFNAEVFDNVIYDLDKLKQFITDNKNHVGADSEDEILSINTDGYPEMLYTTRKINLLFDEVAGDFSFETGMDTNFVKGYFSAPDILSGNTELFNLPDNLLIKRTKAIPDEWMSYKYQLPSTFSFKGKLSVHDPSECLCDDAFALDELGFTFADITSSSVGRGYIAIEKGVHVLGLEGSKNSVLFVSRPLSPEEITRIFSNLRDVQDLSNLEILLKFLPIADLAGDEEFQSSIIGQHLESSEDVVSSINELKKIKAVKKPSVLSSIVESSLCNREKDVDSIIDILQKSGIKCGCEEICSKFKSDDSNTNLKLADKLFPICQNKSIVTAALGIRGAIAEQIMSGRAGSYESKELLVMNNTAKALLDLKKYFGINTIRDYDLNKYDESQNENVLKAYSIATKGISDIDPIMTGSEEYSELKEYMDLIQNLTEVYCKDVPLESLRGYQFGVGIRRKGEILLSANVKKAELIAMIDEAYSKDLIDEDEQTVLHMIRMYGNECVHTSDVVPVDGTKKQEWVKTVNNLEKRLKIKEVKK